MRLFRILAAVIAVAGSTLAADFFPLQQGNTWTYRHAASGQTLTITVGVPVMINGNVYNVVRGYADAPLLVRLNEKRDLVQVDEETGREQLLTMFEGSVGDWWKAPGRPCEEEGQTQERRGVHDGPARVINDVLEIRYRILNCADLGVDSEQYTENIGMVRRVLQSFIGPRQFDLVAARIGNFTVDAAPHSTFTVSAVVPKSGDISAVLTLQTNGGELKLELPSGQMYDLAVRDEAGNQLWKWSDGKFFTLALRKVVISGQWSATIAIPRGIFAGHAPGNYTINGWLTATNANPQFASTLSLAIAD